MSERWLPVSEFPGYEVSDQGRVRSLDRVVLSRWDTPKRLKGKVLVQVIRGGRWGCDLYRDGKRRPVLVHVLMLEVFVGPRPEGMYGLHRDDDPDNNRLENLYWGTPAQNSRDAVNNGLCWKSNITHCPQGHEYTPENTYIVPKTGYRQCIACRKARAEARRTRPHPRDRNRCPLGHAYSGKNNQGRRICRECNRAACREYRRRRKAKRPT